MISEVEISNKTKRLNSITTYKYRIINKESIWDELIRKLGKDKFVEHPFTSVGLARASSKNKKSREIGNYGLRVCLIHLR